MHSPNTEEALRPPQPGEQREMPHSLHLAYLRSYCWTAPLLFVSDLFFGLDLRIPHLEGSPFVHYGFYLLCVCIGLVAQRWPVGRPMLAVVESGLSVLCFATAILVPIYAGPASEELPAVVSIPVIVVNFLFLLCGLVLNPSIVPLAQARRR